jgi:hypothetical protein
MLAKCSWNLLAGSVFLSPLAVSGTKLEEGEWGHSVSGKSRVYVGAFAPSLVQQCIPFFVLDVP